MSRACIATMVGAGVLLVWAPAESGAQSEIPSNPRRPLLRLEVAKPLFDVGPFAEAHFLTTVWDATLVVPIEGAPTLFARLGLAVGSIDGIGWSGTVSKPRVGALFGRARGVHAVAHVDLPFAQEMGGDFSTGVGRFTRFEEWERFGPGSWALGGSVTVQSELSPGAYVGARAGGTLILPTESDVDRDAFALYSVFGDAPAGRARLWIEFSGVALLTQSGLNFSERTAFFATVSLSSPNGRLAPEAYVRAPLDENLAGLVNFILGLRVHVSG